MNLVIVESPNKIKSIKKVLGSDYEVKASVGHIRDLPASKLGVDIENNFEPQYIQIKGKAKVVNELKAAAKGKKVYLATDPDREGEAISWHLANTLGLDVNEVDRVTFYELTKSGIQAGMAAPRKINMDLVDAQQARRVLDRLVGYKISPFLWRKIRRGLSAGRVQSVAVKLVVDREEEIRNFNSEEYWSIDAKLLTNSSRKVINAKLTGKDGKKIKLKNAESANEVLDTVKSSTYTVSNVKKGNRKKQPAAPFITSTMQQEAARKLNFQGYRTMKAAQELYEGIELEGLGTTGLITYMRTDSIRISEEAQNEAAKLISETYGKEYLPVNRRVFKAKATAQDAHEAIRPSIPSLRPEQVKDSLSSDQYRLYKLIWERFIASQMADSLLETVSVDIDCAEYNFKASGFTVVFDGFTRLYIEGCDDKDEENEESLPPIEKGTILKTKEVSANQHFTQPPARYTESTLIKALEENGIGRPSTYVSILSTILSRMYVEKEQKVYKPTVLGETVNSLLKTQFSDIVDVDFTANMESRLDEVADGKREWHGVISDFYGGFEKTLETAEKNLDGTRVKVPDEETDEVCELCGKPMVIKIGRYGKFMACSGFPDCRNTKKIVEETTGVCPKCGGKIIAKKSKKGRKFYGCGNYPDCDFASWNIPTDNKCPKCGSTLFKKSRQSGILICEKDGCGYECTAKASQDK